MCGYHVDFGKNLVVLVGLMAILGLTLVVLAFASIIHKRVSNYRKWVSNFSHRFFYQFLFEILLCMLIHIKLSNETNDFTMVLVLIFSLLTIGITCFLLTRLCHGGPSQSSFFGKGTLL